MPPVVSVNCIVFPLVAADVAEFQVTLADVLEAQLWPAGGSGAFLQLRVQEVLLRPGLGFRV